MLQPQLITESELNKARELLTALKRFAMSGELRKEFELSLSDSLDIDQPPDMHETEALRDWFTFEWLDDDDNGVIDRFISEGNLSTDENDLLLDWVDSFSGVFEVQVATRSSIRVRDLETGDLYEIIPDATTDTSSLRHGQFVNARLLLLGDRFIFSYPPMLMPNRSAAIEAVQRNRIYNSLNSPEVHEEMIGEIREAFCEYFGSDETTVTPEALSETIQGFIKYMFFVRLDPETDTTMAESFKSQFNEDLWIPALGPMPPEISNASEVTILCDEFDGIMFLPEYSLFKRVFETPNPNSLVPAWRELVWAYIKDPAIPTAAFERVAEKHPKRMEKIMSELLEEEDFSINHLYCALLHFKEPAEGFDDLKDDEKLWDLFDGQKKMAKAVKAPSTAAKSKSTRARGAKPASSRARVTASSAAGGTRKKTRARS